MQKDHEPIARHLLQPFFEPRGIVYMGAATESPASRIKHAHALRWCGYRGSVMVVNPEPSGQTQSGLSFIPRIAKARGHCDVALLALPAPDVVPALEACASAEIFNAVVLASGFQPSICSKRRQAVLDFLAATPQFRLIGPNCAGTMSAVGGGVLSTVPALLDGSSTIGHVGLVLQSGGIATGLLLALLKRAAGFAHWVSTGDELGLGAIRIATAMVDDPRCNAVGMFIEGISDAQYLPELAEAITRTSKPVIAVRSGSSIGSREAAFGHTGRIIGDSEIASAALEQAGVRIVATIDELCDTMTVLSIMRPRTGRPGAAVAVVASAGGAGVVVADEIAHTPNLSLATLAQDSREAIAKEVRSPLPVANPYDIPGLGDAGVFPRAIRAMGTHSGCDAMVVVTMAIVHDYESLSCGDYEALPPIIFAHLSPDDRFSIAQAQRLADLGIPSVPSIHHAIRALSHWAGHDEYAPTSSAEAKRDESPDSSSKSLGLIQSTVVLGDRLNRWLAPSIELTSALDAIEFARRFHGGIAVKAEGTYISHRSEFGAVRTHLRFDQEIIDAYEEVASICGEYGDAVVAQEMADPGTEIFVSILRDPEFGPVALCRPGGNLVELHSDTAVLTERRQTWKEVLSRSTAGQVLNGYRGRPRSDLSALLDFIADALDVMRSNTAVLGIECNPVVVHPIDRIPGTRGLTAVDLLTYANL